MGHELFDEIFRGYGTFDGWLTDFNRGDLIEKIRAWNVLIDEADALGEIHKLLQMRIDHIRFTLVPDEMMKQDIESIRVAEVGTIYLTDDLSVSIQEGKKEEAYQWLGDTGHGDLVVSTVNASSLKAFIKRAVKDGDQIPSDLFKMSPITRAAIKSK